MAPDPPAGPRPRAEFTHPASRPARSLCSSAVYSIDTNPFPPFPSSSHPHAYRVRGACARLRLRPVGGGGGVSGWGRGHAPHVRAWDAVLRRETGGDLGANELSTDCCRPQPRELQVPKSNSSGSPFILGLKSLRQTWRDSFREL